MLINFTARTDKKAYYKTDERMHFRSRYWTPTVCYSFLSYYLYLLYLFLNEDLEVKFS